MHVEKWQTLHMEEKIERTNVAWKGAYLTNEEHVDGITANGKDMQTGQPVGKLPDPNWDLQKWILFKRNHKKAEIRCKKKQKPSNKQAN